MISYQNSSKELTILLEGDICGYDDKDLKTELYRTVKETAQKKIIVEAQGLKSWDSTLVGMVYEIAKQKSPTATLEYNHVPKNLIHLVELALSVDRKPPVDTAIKSSFLDVVGQQSLEKYKSFCASLAFIKTCFFSIMRLVSGRAIMRKVDFLFALEGCSYQAVGIISLISFMVGLILAFVGAIQMKMFGVEIYVSSLVAIAMTRIMGAIMAGIVMAGRTGAAYAATIGTMQVNEEVDALRTMGIPIHDFLVLPRLSALMLTMPFLTMLSDIMGIIGGAAVGVLMLDFSIEEYWQYTQNALKMSNFLLGLLHGFVYGLIIASCGCYYGVHCGRNADSVGVATTKAVVSSIVWMIVITGILTVIIEEAGA